MEEQKVEYDNTEVRRFCTCGHIRRYHWKDQWSCRRKQCGCRRFEGRRGVDLASVVELDELLVALKERGYRKIVEEIRGRLGDGDPMAVLRDLAVRLSRDVREGLRAEFLVVAPAYWLAVLRSPEAPDAMRMKAARELGTWLKEFPTGSIGKDGTGEMEFDDEKILRLHQVKALGRSSGE